MDRSKGMMFEMEKSAYQYDDNELNMTRSHLKQLEAENDQLRVQVKELQLDRDAIHSALDEVHDKLEETAFELEYTRQELATKIQESANQTTQISTSKLKSQTLSQDELEKMRIELHSKEEAILRQESVWKDQIERIKTEFEARLISQGEETQGQLGEQISEHQKPDRKWLDEIRKLEARFDNDLKAERASSQRLLLEKQAEHLKAVQQIQSLQSQLQSAQQEVTTMKTRQTQLPLSLQIQVPQTSPSVQKAGSEEFQRLMAEMRASHAAELEESRRLTSFYKNNSERNSREAKELRTTNRNLLESVEAKDREIEDQLSHIYAVQAQMEEMQQTLAARSVPGGWQGD